MDFSKVKLVVTDMDGTLLNSKSQVSPLFFELFEKLKEKNIHFIAASGRQYHSIVDRFETIKNDITIVAENGGIAKRGDTELFSVHLNPNDIIAPILKLRTLKNTFIVLCGKKKAYIETSDSEFIKMFSNYYSEYEIVEDLTKVTNDDFLKIAAYHSTCSETYIYPTAQQFSSNFQVIVSGEHWLDISHQNAHKGYALNILQKEFGVTKAETMVFGDYNNDLKMLALADFSFAMENAHPNVKKAARFSTKSNDNFGVESILAQLV